MLAIAIFGMVLAFAFDGRLPQELRRAHAPPEAVSAIVAQRQKLAGATVPEGLPGATRADLKQAVGHSFVFGFRWVMLLSAALALLSSLSAWVLIAGKAEPKDPKS